jgi:uncharacterized membrane protein YfhO
MKRTKRTKSGIQSPKKQEKKQIVKKEYTKNNYSKYFNLLSLILLIFIIGFLAFSKYLSGEYLFFFKDIGSDSINQNYPALVHKVSLLKEGFFSKWSFYKGMGDIWNTLLPYEPLGVLRNMINYTGAKIAGVNFFVFGRFWQSFIFFFLLTGIISFIYFRTIAVSKINAFIGALLIVFSGYMVVGAGWGFSSHLFKAMFLLLAFEQLYLKKHWYFFPFAVIYLSGNPFVLFIYAGFLLLYSLFRYFSVPENSFTGYLKLAGQMILLGIVGLLMNFAQFYKAFIKMYNSPRVAGSASYSNILSAGQDITEHANLGATTLLRFFSSDILGTGSNFQGWYNYLEAPLFYIGLLSLLLFPQIFTYLNKRKKIVFGAFAGFWALTLFYPYLRYAVLAFTGDYFRYGFDFFIPFTILLYSILALNNIDKNFAINLKLLFVTLVILLAVLYFPYSSIPESAINNNLRLLISLLLIVYTGLIILMTKSQYKQYAQIALLLLIVFELSYFSYKSYAGRVPITREEFAKDAGGYNDGTPQAVKYLKTVDKTLFYRCEKDYQSGNAEHGSLNDALAQGYYGTTSYSSFNQLNYVRFLEETGLIPKGDETSTRWITGFRGNPLLLTFGNIKYFFSKSAKSEMLRFGFDSLSVQNGIYILKNRFYLPFGYTYDKYIDFKDYQSLIHYQINPISLNNLQQIFERDGNKQIWQQVAPKLNSLSGINFTDKNQFIAAIEQKTGKETAQKYHFSFFKYCVNNFANQIALLNAFVFDKNDIPQNLISGFTKINPQDSSIFIPAQKFNFNIYEQMVNRLKQDTFKISSFKQSEIEGKIKLSKTKMLFFTIPFDKGWKIRVNGKEKELLRTNIGFTGIILPKGDYSIKLYFIPQNSQLTNAVSLISSILFWLYLGFWFYKRRNVKKLAYS